MSPNYGLLAGMEISARSVEKVGGGMRRKTLMEEQRRSAEAKMMAALPSPGAVGVAF
jgi:hypothetical protein